MEENKEIDWKEFSRKLLFEGVIPAVSMITDHTDNKIDDTVMDIAEKLGKMLLPEPKKEENVES